MSQKNKQKKSAAKKINHQNFSASKETVQNIPNTDKLVKETLVTEEIKKPVENTTPLTAVTISSKEDKVETKAVETKNLATKSVKISTASSTINNKTFLDGFFSSLVGEKKELTRYEGTIRKILDYDETMKKKSDTELKEMTLEFRKRLKGLEAKKDIDKKLEEILPEAFAVVREAASRTIGQKHYPVQLIGGMVLHEGRISEMRTGEGKTLVSTLSGYLNALPENQQVHLVTVNDYLARRDASWMGRIYDFLGLTVGIIQNQASFYFQLGAESDIKAQQKRDIGMVETFEDGVLDDRRAVLDVENLVRCDRKRAYWIPDQEDIADNNKSGYQFKGKPVDVVYGVNSEFGFDYLRDNMANTPEEITQRAGHHTAIIDEVDSILIDEARTPLIISAQDNDSSNLYKQFAGITAKLNPELDYEVDEKRRTVTLTDLGLEKVERLLGIPHLYENSGNVTLIHHLEQALKARSLFRREKEYVTRDGEIIIVDENTGRLMFGRRFNQGLHQAIEAKESVTIQSESKTTATITFQNYFRLYAKLSGMTGTAATESEELFKIYKLLVVTIPTNKPVIRQDLVDKIFKTEEGKFSTIVKDIKEIHATGQPILIGTTSIEKNLTLSQLLTQAGVKHEVLNAKNHEQEARIISQAGKKGAVTVATNIAGRGIDIKLGGEVPEETSEYPDWKKDHEEVKNLGGLFVIGTERHESRRIDNQLRGRAGRQGDNGKTQFYISLDDYIVRVFGGERVSYYKQVLPIADDEAIQNKLLSKLIEEAQKKIEGQNFDSRKYVTDYDDVINRQRKVIYARRKSVLLNDGFDWKKEVEKAMAREVLRSISQITKTSRGPNKLQLETSSKELKEILALTDFDPEVLSVLLKDHNYNYSKVAGFLSEKLNYQLKTRWEIYEDKVQAAMARFVFLRAIDILWTEHLVTIDHLQDSVRLRSYSQKDPLTEFKQDGMTVFVNLLQEIDTEISRTLFKVNPDIVPAGIMQS